MLETLKITDVPGNIFSLDRTIAKEVAIKGVGCLFSATLRNNPGN